MYVLNKDELVPMLRTHLRDYLVSQGVCQPHEKKFKCFVHNDEDPSMQFDPKRDDEVVHCFACGADVDIFAAAEILEGLPQNGAEWITHTMPTLAKRFEVPVTLGEPSTEEAEKMRLYQLAQDIADILISPKFMTDAYPSKRGWTNDDIKFGTVSEDELLAKLVEKGYTAAFVKNSMIMSAGTAKWFGKGLVTTPVKDFRGRTVAFISRNTGKTGPKYINSCESPIYKKGAQFLGMDTALKPAKYNGLYIVEGMGDLAQLRRLGVRNSVAVAGTAFTPDHLLLLKGLGIRDLYFCLDWDEPGQTATAKIFDEVLRHAPGVNCYVIEGPEGFNDPDEFLVNSTDRKDFTNLPVHTAFNWMMRRIPQGTPPADICIKMIPIIAAESLTVRRDVLIQQLSDYTGIHYTSISTDVNAIRDNKFEERRDRLKTAGMKYMRALETDPDSVSALLGQHEDELRRIERDYEKDIIGPSYQLAKFEAVEDLKKPDDEGNSRTHFKFAVFTDFAKAIGKGMQSTAGVVIYFPGRQNSGKTATMIALSTDVLLHDTDAIVVYHFTDDMLDTVQPRIMTNIAAMTRSPNDHVLTIQEAGNPYETITSNAGWAEYNRVRDIIMEMMREEKLVIIDSEEGDTLTALERQLAYIRRKNSGSKLLMVCDNTHNYQDGAGGSNDVGRWTSIANRQKAIARKYKAAMWTSAEYRKNQPKKMEELKLPVDDDILGAGAFAYRANAIVHVYNDLNDRADFAEAYWTDPFEPDVPKPRLQLIISKNKIANFKGKLVVDLDPRTVTVKPISLAQAKLDTAAHRQGQFQIKNGMLLTEAEDYEPAGENYE